MKHPMAIDPNPPPRSLWMEGYNYSDVCNQISDLYYWQTLKVISQCQCSSTPRLFQLIRPLHLSPFLLNLTLHYERSGEQTFLRKTARGLEGGQGRWDWEKRKGMGVWNSVEKAGAVMWARRDDTQSVCQCNGGRFDTRVSAVPVSIGRSFHYQSAPLTPTFCIRNSS